MKNRRLLFVSRLPVALITVAFLLTPTLPGAFGEGFRNPPDGAAALGRVGGKIALAEDPSALSHNPANLTLIEEPQAMAALTVLKTEAEFTSPLGFSAKTEDDWKYLPNLYVVSPMGNDSAVLGIGVTTPFGQSTEWDEQGGLRYLAPYHAELRVANVNPTLAWKLGENFSVAAGFDAFWSDLSIKQVLPSGSPVLPDVVQELDVDGEGFGGNAALTWMPTKRQRLALTYRSPVEVDYSGDARIYGPPLLAVADADTSIEFPAGVGAGYAIEVSDRIWCEVNAEWIEFSSYDALTLETEGAAPLVAPQDWEDSWTFGAGVDWRYSERWTLRAGYIFIESPIPDETLAPTLPDGDRQVVTVGAGYRNGAHRLDVAYGYSLFEDREIRTSLNPAYNGTYELCSQLFGISYGLAF